MSMHRWRVFARASWLFFAVAALLGGSVVSVAAQPDVTGTPGALVTLRVEGATATIFEGTVFTRGHDVTTPSGGTHHCDGTNNNANPKPGPTATSALDDGARQNGFTWDGTYSTEFDDYFITRIANDAQTADQFWGILRNGQFTEVGGCQQQVNQFDEVLFAFDAFNKSQFLRLEGPRTARVNQPITVTVTDSITGNPAVGATVNGATTDANGLASVTFTSVGMQQVKAEHPQAIRSNRLEVMVTP
ncbi:Ig-like domain-containing protein [Nocardia brasiliensis]|uniref:Ig-like domain-containing protein n=1 Tax=Nocardia brasiliensis TaxID=37326 RepID=UPI0036706A4A